MPSVTHSLAFQVCRPSAEELEQAVRGAIYSLLLEGNTTAGLSLLTRSGLDARLTLQSIVLHALDAPARYCWYFTLQSAL